MTSIDRRELRIRIEEALGERPVCCLCGPRQVGKTGLARAIAGADGSYFDLEDPDCMERFENPESGLDGLDGLIVIDEIQRMPEIVPRILHLVEGSPNRRFILIGSAPRSVMRKVTEPLGDRVCHLSIEGFSLFETGFGSLGRLWLRGGFPSSYLALTDEESHEWRNRYLVSVAERDMPPLGASVAPRLLMRFLSMLARVQATVWNSADLSRALGICETTVRKYIEICADLGLIRLLDPWLEHLGKRQVKSPKVFITDTGLLHALLGIRTNLQLLGHESCDASWETFVIGEIFRIFKPDEGYFWATHAGASLDLLAFKNGKRYGFDIRRDNRTTPTPSMRIAAKDLELDRTFVINPGEREFDLADRVSVLPFAHLSRLASA